MPHRVTYGKGIHPKKIIRARSDNFIRFVSKMLEKDDPVILENGCELYFLNHDPVLDFSRHNLSREIDDDFYVATAIELSEKYGAENVIIATNDSGLSLKLRGRGIKRIALNHELSLPSIIDDDDRELQSLRRENAALKAAKPNLEVSFSDASRLLKIQYPREVAVSLTSPTDKRALFEKMQEISSEERGLGLAGRNLHFARDVERYNQELEEYFMSYEKFYNSYHEISEMLRTSSKIRLRIDNFGNQTATDIDIEVKFPDSVIVFPSDILPALPEEPQAPTKPSALGSAFSRFDWANVAMESVRLAPHFTDISLPSETDVTVDSDERTVSMSIRSLKRKCFVEFEEFYIGWS